MGYWSRLRLRAEFGAHRLSALWHQASPESMGVRCICVACFAVALLSALCIRFAFGAVAVYAPYSLPSLSPQ